MFRLSLIELNFGYSDRIQHSTMLQSLSIKAIYSYYLLGIPGPCDIGMNSDKLPYYWLYQYHGQDRLPVLVAESISKNMVRLFVVVVVLSSVITRTAHVTMT